MSIELEFNTTTIQQQDIEEIYPNLISKIQSYLQTQKTPKKRKYRKRKTVSHLIDEILDDIQTK